MREILFVLFFCLNSLPSNAQKQLSATIGAGFPELVNVGAKFRYQQIEAGGTVGYTTPTLTLGLQAYFHFGGKSKYTTLNPWFFRLGGDYVVNQDDHYGYADFRVGRDINFSTKTGMNISAGALIEVYKHIKASELNLDLPFLPAVGAMFYYNFLH